MIFWCNDDDQLENSLNFNQNSERKTNQTTRKNENFEYIKINVFIIAQILSAVRQFT